MPMSSRGVTTSFGRSTVSAVWRVAATVLLLLVLVPEEAHASFLSPEMEDKMATFLAIFILFIVSSRGEPRAGSRSYAGGPPDAEPPPRT